MSLWAAVHQPIIVIPQFAHYENCLQTWHSSSELEYSEQQEVVMLPPIVLELPSNSGHVWQITPLNINSESHAAFCGIKSHFSPLSAVLSLSWVV